MAATSNAVILARVSSKSQEDEGYSLDSQLKLLRGYCENKDLNVIRIFKIAETASKQQSRKVFQELLEFISNNGIYHLAVEKTDRLTRNLRDAVSIDDWLEGDSQRMLHAVKENLLLHKASKSDVKFMWSIHLAVAKKYTDNLREEAMKGWAEKLAQGWLPAPPPIGYKTVSHNSKRIHVVDSETVKSMQKLFRQYLEPGQSIASICKAMERMGLTTSRGKPFAKSHVQRILTNPFYIGVNRFNGRDYPGAQEPIISKSLFRAVQAKMTSGSPAKFQKHNPLLKNVMTCEHCGKTVTWQIQKGRYYGSCQRRTEACKSNKFVREDTVEDRAKSRFKKLVCPSPLVMKWVVESIGADFETDKDNHEEVVRTLQSKIARMEKMDEMLYDDKLSGEITASRYEQKHTQFTGEIEKLRSRVGTVDEDAARLYEHGVSIIELSQKAIDFYEESEVDARRSIITKLFGKMTVKGDSISVTYTKLTRAIAAKSEESRVLMHTLKLDNLTFQNNKNNRGGHKEKELDLALRPIWQG